MDVPIFKFLKYEEPTSPKLIKISVGTILLDVNPMDYSIPLPMKLKLDFGRISLKAPLGTIGF